MILKGKIVDIHNRKVFNGAITIDGALVTKVHEINEECSAYIMPGFIDAHVHIESSMVTPGSFAEVAVTHGTVAVVADPHEIGNVLGVRGIDFMIENASKVPLKFYFGAPSCVPATAMESNGAVIGVEEIRELMKRDDIRFLGEMMNFPGVLNDDIDVMEKIGAARAKGKPVDGHAPGLRGEELSRYIDSGISTDHEATTLAEAREKIEKGMKIVIREGSAARNLESLHPLVGETPESVMLCCDDIHPEMLINRHINSLVVALTGLGYDLFDILQVATLNPINHYGIEVGSLRVGDRADFIIVDNLQDFRVMETWIEGSNVYSDGQVKFRAPATEAINRFKSSYITKESIAVLRRGEQMRAIEVFDGELYTAEKIVKCKGERYVESDTESDILKIVVKERYHDNAPVVGFIHGFGLKSGAFAGSIAHDSHNIIAVGSDDESIIRAINRVVEMEGGLALCDNGVLQSLQLNIAGIMSNVPCGTIAGNYEQLSDKVKDMGCHLKSPFMTLSFMTLLVIPDLKLGDRGLFNLKQFGFIDLFI